MAPGSCGDHGRGQRVAVPDPTRPEPLLACLGLCGGHEGPSLPGMCPWAPHSRGPRAPPAGERQAGHTVFLRGTGAGVSGRKPDHTLAMALSPGPTRSLLCPGDQSPGCPGLGAQRGSPGLAGSLAVPASVPCGHVPWHVLSAPVVALLLPSSSQLRAQSAGA